MEVCILLNKPTFEVECWPYEELLKWYAYLEKRPLGWREDDRAAKIIQSNGVKESATKLFPALDRIYNPSKFEDNGIETLKGSYLFHKMLGAVGGDKLDL